MEAPPVRCETFVLSTEALPSVEALLQASDPQQLEEVYRAAGLDMQADNAGPIGRAHVAAKNYEEMPTEVYKLYANFLTQVVKLKNCLIPLPEEALSVLVVARGANLFDNFRVLTHPTSGECLLLGWIQVSGTVRYFKIAHWGYVLTTIKQLRRRQRFSRMVGLRLRCPSSVYFGAVTILAASPCWLLLLPISWWLFAAVLAGVMTFCGYYVAKRSSYNSAQRWTVGWLIAANAVAALVMGIIHINHWATTDRTEEVLVCGVHEARWGGDEWIIETSAGMRTLEGGFYNGTYYPTGNESVARSLIGKWVKITEHGYGSGDSDSPYVTEAKTLRTGSCG